ncbi:MAG: PqqD family protein [Agathobacter sp.]|nr:PqqD family protein [Agathobacter sp.]
MAKQKKIINQNYLENIPMRNEALRWEKDEAGMVTLFVHNKGIMNKIMQKLLKKPEYTQVHLDENGSFIWPLIDGKTDILELGLKVKEHFGEKAEPLYPRIAKFIQILESYAFISLKTKDESKKEK